MSKLILVGVLEEILAELKIVRKALKPPEPVYSEKVQAMIKEADKRDVETIDNVFIWLGVTRLETPCHYKYELGAVYIVNHLTFGKDVHWTVRNDNDYGIKIVWADNTMYVQGRARIELNIP